MKRQATLFLPRSLVWIISGPTLGLFGLGGCDAPAQKEQGEQQVAYQLSQAGPLVCAGTSCTQDRTPLPNFVAQRIDWDPCDGEGFSYSISGQFETNYDFIRIGERNFTGFFSNRAGSASGPVQIRLRTDYSVRSEGVYELTAMCEGDDAGTSGGSGDSSPSSGGASTDTGSTNPGPGTIVDGPLSCTGLTCVTEQPLSNNVNASVTWDPCNGGGFSYSGQGSFETNYDQIIVGGRAYTGSNVSLSGSASGPIEVRVITDYSISSLGLSELRATCDAGGSDSAGTTTTGGGGDPGGGSTDTSDSTATDPSGAVALRCVGDRCETPNTPLANNLRALVNWDPCNGGPFRYSGQVQFENGYDRIWVGASAFTGNTDISGQEPGPADVRIRTDYSIRSGGIRTLVAECEGDDSTTTTTGPDDTSSSAPDDTSSSTPDDTSTDDTDPGDGTPTLRCEGLSCTSSPTPLPPNQNLVVNRWDPCNGGAFSVNGQISINENIGQSTRDFFTLEGYVFTGTRPVQVNLPGPARVELVTVAAGTDPSSGIQSLTANCSPESYGLSCSGTSCSTGASVLPGMMNEQQTWDPCDGGAFTWEGEISTEQNSDFVTIAGTRYTGPNTSVSGSASAAITVAVQTDRFGDSIGIQRLEATCSDDPGGGNDGPFPGPMMTDWSPSEVAAYARTAREYIVSRGVSFLNFHASWHARNDVGADANGDGGTSGHQGPGSGMAFVGMHRAMMNGYRNYASGGSGRVMPRPINPYAALPDGLPDAEQAVRETPGAPLAWYIPRMRTSYAGSNLGLPRFLMIGGAGDGSGPAVGESYRLKNDRNPNRAGRLITALEQFQDPDEIGEAMGVSGYHGRGHWWIGGTLGISYSPLDPIFWGWHQLLDDILQNWLDNTQNGRNWVQDNPGHPLLSRTNDNMNPWRDRATALSHGGIALP